MSKLFFRYGAMNSGKSTALLQVAHNYEERGQRVILLKPRIDTKGGGQIVSRLGVAREADILLERDDDLYAQVRRYAHDNLSAFACVLIDEAQFLTAAQVDQALQLAVFASLPVVAYGIRTDFRTQSFPGSQRLLEVAHKLEELKTICRCGQKAIFNARLSNGVIIREGNQVLIDQPGVHYEALCAHCFLDPDAKETGN